MKLLLIFTLIFNLTSPSWAQDSLASREPSTSAECLVTGGIVIIGMVLARRSYVLGTKQERAWKLYGNLIHRLGPNNIWTRQALDIRDRAYDASNAALAWSAAMFGPALLSLAFCATSKQEAQKIVQNPEAAMNNETFELVSLELGTDLAYETFSRYASGQSVSEMTDLF